MVILQSQIHEQAGCPSTAPSTQAVVRRIVRHVCEDLHECIECDMAMERRDFVTVTKDHTSC